MDKRWIAYTEWGNVILCISTNKNEAENKAQEYRKIFPIDIFPKAIVKVEEYKE